jgi:hypothetical protein
MLERAIAKPKALHGEGVASEGVSEGVLEMSAEFGCWLFHYEGGSLIYHLDGRKFFGHAEREKWGPKFNTTATRYRLAEFAATSYREPTDNQALEINDAESTTGGASSNNDGDVSGGDRIKTVWRSGKEESAKGIFEQKSEGPS